MVTGRSVVGEPKLPMCAGTRRADQSLAPPGEQGVVFGQFARQSAGQLVDCSAARGTGPAIWPGGHPASRPAGATPLDGRCRRWCPGRASSFPFPLWTRGCKAKTQKVRVNLCPATVMDAMDATRRHEFVPVVSKSADGYKFTANPNLFTQRPRVQRTQGRDSLQTAITLRPCLASFPSCAISSPSIHVPVRQSRPRRRRSVP